LDGQALTDVSIRGKGEGCGDDRWVAPTFSTLGIGWQHHQTTSTAVDMWIDDLVVADKPIGCPAPK
jgi:hypothetical protein